MRRMYSEKQIKDLIIGPEDVVEDLKGQDINVNGITSKGIANTGNIANIGDIATTGKITGGEIIENMIGYTYIAKTLSGLTIDYASVCKNGNKLTFVLAFNVNFDSIPVGGNDIAEFTIPAGIYSKLLPTNVGSLDLLDLKKVLLIYSSSSFKEGIARIYTQSANTLTFDFIFPNDMITGTKYYGRYEATFLLSDNLAPEEP